MEPEGKGSVSPEQARRMLASNEASAIDIRDDEAWVGGHIPGARTAARKSSSRRWSESTPRRP